MSTIVSGPVRRNVGFQGRGRTYRSKRLKPRGALSRPAGAHLSIEVFNEKPGEYSAVRITSEAHGKIRALVEVCRRLEVSWLSPTTVAPDGGAVIYDVLVPHQECSGGNTAKLETKEIDGEDRLLCDLIDQGKHQMIKDLICWGHSHVNSNVFASSLDQEVTDDFLRRMREMGKTRFVRVIANKGDDLFVSLYLLDEGKAIHHAPIEAELPDTKRWMAWARREVKEKVTEKIYEREDYDDEWFVDYYNRQFAQFQHKLRLQSGEQATTGDVPSWPTKPQK